MSSDLKEKYGENISQAFSNDGISRLELLLELFRRMRGAARMVLNRKPKLVRTVEYVLRAFLQRESKLSLDRYPRQHFCTQQVILVGIFILHGLHSKSLTFLDLREDLGNLAYLLDFLKHHYPTDAAHMQAYLRKYLAILEELCATFEKATQMIRTDWAALKEAYQRFEEPPPSVEIVHLVPSIADIEVFKLLGAGGFGACYKLNFGGATLAGKLIPMERIKAPKHACADKVVASMINSPFLIRYHACFNTDKAYVTIMEYIKGVDLNRLIRVGEPLELKAIALMLAQLGLAVRYLHYRGFIHRDIKPANIMALPGGRIRLIDLETCKTCTPLYGDGYTRSFRHRTFGEFKDSEVAGTLLFFSPETIAREAYGRATDFWAIGVTAYSMGAGKLPFRGKEEEVRKSIWAGDYQPLQNHPQLAQFIGKLLLRDARRRLTTARFEDYQKEDIFAGIDWDNLDKDFLCEVRQFEKLIKRQDDGTWSVVPRSERRRRKKPRKQLKFDEVANITKHEKLFTFFTNSFHNFLLARSANSKMNAIFETDGNYDFIPAFTERRRRATYRFQDSLQWNAYNLSPESGPAVEKA